jgi:hypothetical protein
MGLWFLAIFFGGYLICKAVFNLRSQEYLITGITLGIVCETVFVSIIGRVIPAPASFYLSAGLVFIIGFILYLLDKGKSPLFDKSIITQSLVILPVGILLFFICRGMGIFDDYAQLPTTSLIAAGDIPPHFALNRAVPYAYHYFLMLFAGQVVRVGDVFPWVALDMARSISLILAVFAGGLWTSRLTRNKYVGLLGGLFVALGGGARWLLLLLPEKNLEGISKLITLIGSGASTGFTFIEAILADWKVEGLGKLPIPFAFTNGIVQPGVLSMHGANGLMDILILTILLLTYNRWRNWKGAAVSAVILSSLSLVGEADLALILAGWGIVVLLSWIKNKKVSFTRQQLVLGGAILGGFILSLFEGGAFVDILKNWVEPAAKSYQTVGFALTWPPSIVSAHLGVLSLTNPWTLLVALFEIGPVLLILPLVIIWGYKAWKNNRWFEAALIFGFGITIASILVNFSGSTGVRNTSRLYYFLIVASIYFVPLLWNWASHRTDVIRYGSMAIYTISLVGGFVLFANQLPSVQSPVIAPFMTELDAKTEQKYWNKLDRNAMVFDPIPYRAVVIFGRAVEVGSTWYDYDPKWEAFYQKPDPVELHKAGYDYVYVDEDYWNDQTIRAFSYLSNPCVRQMEALKMWPEITRKMFDISKCK